ncbi:MAG: hypothetical protein K0S91_2572 [Nitrososphaeraceae archaeon]|nr:hypothetical protein [Nitrososphaeraceae archaeon]
MTHYVNKTLFQYINLIKIQSVIPEAKIAKPTPEIKKPLIVHSGLLYIKEDCGPTIDLLCAVNTNPAIISIDPTTINVLLRYLLFIYPLSRYYMVEYL